MSNIFDPFNTKATGKDQSRLPAYETPVIGNSSIPNIAQKLINSTGIPIATTSDSPSAVASAPTTDDTNSIAALGGIEGFFLRGIIIILGFIFVGIGLSMFRPGIVQAALPKSI